MGPDIKGKNVYGKFPIPSHKLASLRSASKKGNHTYIRTYTHVMSMTEEISKRTAHLQSRPKSESYDLEVEANLDFHD